MCTTIEDKVIKYIKDYIRLNYSVDDPFWKIEDYIYSFLQDEEITETQYDNLITWAKEWYNS